jgi:hypothetical protein
MRQTRPHSLLMLLDIRFLGLAFRVHGLGLKVSGLGFQGSGFRAYGFRVRINLRHSPQHFPLVKRVLEQSQCWVSQWESWPTRSVCERPRELPGSGSP